jgi:hypothetical protein
MQKKEYACAGEMQLKDAKDDVIEGVSQIL